MAGDGLSPIAAEALRRIAEVYAIETTIRGQPSAARKNVRQAKSLSLVDAMKVWLETTHIPPRCGLADALSRGLMTCCPGIGSPQTPQPEPA